MYTKAVDQNYNKILKYDWLSGGYLSVSSQGQFTRHTCVTGQFTHHACVNSLIALL